MLTGRLVRVRYSRDRILPYYLDADELGLRGMAERLLEVFRGQEGKTRGQLEEEWRETFGSDPTQLVLQGLAKLLEDRCEFEVVSDQPPEKLRETVFLAAARERRDSPQRTHREERALDSASSASSAVVLSSFDRAFTLSQAAAELGISPEEVEKGLFADLKSEQRLVRFKDISVERLLERYNVALAQAVILRSTGVHIRIVGEPPQRYRQLLRLVKFHRLVCETERLEPDGYLFHLDGPLSLFSATQKYGLQLALFLPAVLLCRDYEVKAELRWGAQRKPKTFTLTPKDGLVSHHADHGMYVPPELAMFVELFRKKVTEWDIGEETGILPLGEGSWVPDYKLVHRASSRVVWLEVLGFWRRSSVEKHLERLRQHAKEPFLLAVSEQLRIDDAELEGLPGGVYRFRQMPLPEEVVRRAEELLR